MARMMVWCCDGKVITAAGRAIGNDHHDQRNQEKQRWNVAAESLARAHRLLHHAQAGIPERGLLLAAQQEKVAGYQRRHNQEQPEHLRP